MPNLLKDVQIFEVLGILKFFITQLMCFLQFSFWILIKLKSLFANEYIFNINHIQLNLNGNKTNILFSWNDNLAFILRFIWAIAIYKIAFPPAMTWVMQKNEKYWKLTVKMEKLLKLVLLLSFFLLHLFQLRSFQHLHLLFRHFLFSLLSHFFC